MIITEQISFIVTAMYGFGLIMGYLLKTVIEMYRRA